VAVALCAPAVVALSTTTAGASITLQWTINSSGWDRSSSPTIADVNGDGTNEIVIGHENGELSVLNANGSELPGWPRQTGTAIDSTPAVGDLFKNGRKEIVVGLGSTMVPNQQGGVAIYNADGSLHCRFRTGDYQNIWTNHAGPDGYADGVFSSPAIGDINGDGYPDIAFGAFDLHVYAIDRNCQTILSDPIEDTDWSSPALYDINGDGRLDILIGGDQSPGGLVNWRGGEFHAIEWTPAGDPPTYAGYPPHPTSHGCQHCHEIWKRQIGDTIFSSPAVGDIDGDGRPEVVVGAGGYYGTTDGHRVWAWHVDDGSPVPGWPVLTAGVTMPAPALGDLDGNGIPEVAVGSADGWIRVYHGNGSLMWAKRLTHFVPPTPGGPVSSPIIADMNGDGHNDVGVGNDFGFFVLDGRNGGQIAEVNQWLAHESAGAVGNFGGSNWRLIVDGFNTPHHTNTLQGFTIPVPGTTPPWPMFRRDPLHHAGPLGKNLLAPGYCRRVASYNHPSSLSAYGYWVSGVDGAVYALRGAPFKGNAAGRAHGATVAIAATHTGSGYYLLDAGGNVFTFGDAQSFGSMAGHHLNAPIIALAPTPSGRGYWLLGRDGGVFGFGDAGFYGSTGSMKLNAPIISMAATATGHGYWLLASDGGVFSYGDARFHGSTGNLKLAAPIISMAAAASGRGYWLIARDGGIFSFGVPFYGSVPGIGLCRAASAVGVQIRPTLTGKGYFVLAADGRIFSFGDALGGQSAPPLGFSNYATDLAVRR
jgi:hypothetical protein